MVIFGIDAGFNAPGFSIVDQSDSDPTKLRVLFSECFETEAYAGGDRDETYKSVDDARRMVEISKRIAELVRKYKPDVAVVELPTGGAKSSSAIKGMAIGAAVTVTTLYQLDVPRVLITPSENKAAETGHRDAEKDEVFDAVRRRFPDFDGWPRVSKRAKKRWRGTDLDELRCYAMSDSLSTILFYVNTRS